MLKIEHAATDPTRFFETLAGTDERKLRMGGDRLLALLDPASRTVLVERVDPWRRVYR